VPVYPAHKLSVFINCEQVNKCAFVVLGERIRLVICLHPIDPLQDWAKNVGHVTLQVQHLITHASININTQLLEIFADIMQVYYVIQNKIIMSKKEVFTS
jgi:hypothetical protein